MPSCRCRALWRIPSNPGLQTRTTAMLLTQSLPSVEAYVEFFSRQQIPILRRTAQELQYFRDEVADTISVREVAAAVMSDPLMTIRVLMYQQRNRRQSQNHDVTTISRAIMMLGIHPFLTTFLEAPILEEQITHPPYLLGVLRIIARARRAAQFARDWAIVRRDIDVDEITVAALLREATEIVCWCFAPELTHAVYLQQAANPQLRTRLAQKNIFGFTTNEIQHGLVEAWHMPRLLIDLLGSSEETENPRVQTVRLASDFARHLAHRGWDNPALPDDLDTIQTLLHLRRDQLLTRLGVPVEHQARFLPPESDGDTLDHL